MISFSTFFSELSSPSHLSLVFSWMSFPLSNEAAGEGGLELNTNLLETNILNLAILIGLLVYGYQSSIKGTLEERRTEIVQSLENAQTDLVNAKDYYRKANEGYAQSLFWLQSWKQTYEAEKLELIANKYKQAKLYLVELFLTTDLLMLNIERKAFLSLQRYILFVASSRILRKFLGLSAVEKSKLIDGVLKTLANQNTAK